MKKEESKATLVAHSGAEVVTMQDLRNLPSPEPQGRCHKPVRHDYFIDKLSDALKVKGYTIKREQYALGAEGARLFGALDINHGSSLLSTEGVGMAIGFRHANDRTMGYRIVSGARVFVCDNMALSGDRRILSCKHTTNIKIEEKLVESVNELIESYGVLDKNLVRLSERKLTEEEAKVVIYDAFMLRKGVMSLKYMDEVDDWYFSSPKEATDCHPRTLWGLHNAFTRTIKGMGSVVLAYQCSNAVGEYFGLNARQ